MNYCWKIILSGYLIFLSGCNGKLPTNQETISMLQEIEELGTVEYTVTKVVKADDNKTWFKLGERKILITCEAIVKAGINLKELNHNNISRSGKKITIQLPPPKILSVNIPPEKINVAFEKVNMLRDQFTGKERNALMVQAELQIKNSSVQLGIIEQAKINTQLLLSRLLLQLGFDKVVLSYDKPMILKQ